MRECYLRLLTLYASPQPQSAAARRSAPRWTTAATRQDGGGRFIETSAVSAARRAHWTHRRYRYRRRRCRRRYRHGLRQNRTGAGRGGLGAAERSSGGGNVLPVPSDTSSRVGNRCGLEVWKRSGKLTYDHVLPVSAAHEPLVQRER